MITNTLTEASKITFDCHNNTTIVTEQLSIKPLKIVNPKTQKQTGVCMLTSYGGGFVQGDTVTLDVVCNPNTTSIISSQANTRVYESHGVQCRQELHLKLRANAFHVFFNDPLVMHQGGNFVQENSITLETDSVLLFIDWFSAGRTANGETFAFKAFESSTKIEVETQTVVWDNLKITPEEMDVHAPGVFGDHTSFLNVFLVGDKALSKVKLLEMQMLEGLEASTETAIQSNLTRINDHAFVGRFSAEKMTTLKEVMTKMSQILAHPTLLNYDHLERKY